MVNQVFMQGLLAALAAGLVTGIGGFMIFLKRRYLKTEINQLLNLAAGVMLAASFFRCWYRRCMKLCVIRAIFTAERWGMY